MSSDIYGKPIVWLTSYPRSGNTFLRTILWHSFGLRSASVYPNDLGENKTLKEYVGHIDHDPDVEMKLYQNGIPLIKTHEWPEDNNPAIYILRDGRDACVSLWEFWGQRLSLEDVIEGKQNFGTWAGHVDAWHPWDRPDTLFLKYEELVLDLSKALRDISNFMGKEKIRDTITDRSIMVESDGRCIKKKKTDWRTAFSETQLQRFLEINEKILKKTGYMV